MKNFCIFWKKESSGKSNYSSNIFYYSYNHHLSRLYAGIKFIIISLKKVSKEKKIKKIIFLNDLETTNNDILSGNAFDTIFTYFCYQNKIKYKSSKITI